VHCLRYSAAAFRVILPSSPAERLVGATHSECGSTRSMELGSPRWHSVTSKVLPAKLYAGTSSKTRCRGRSALRGGRTMRESRVGRTCSARRGAPVNRHGKNGAHCTAWPSRRAAGSQLRSYSLKSLGEPRVVIGSTPTRPSTRGVLDRDECAQRGSSARQVPHQQVLISRGRCLPVRCSR